MSHRTFSENEQLRLFSPGAYYFFQNESKAVSMEFTIESLLRLLQLQYGNGQSSSQVSLYDKIWAPSIEESLKNCSKTSNAVFSIL